MERHYWKWCLLVLWFSTSGLAQDSATNNPVLDDLAKFLEGIRDSINTFAGLEDKNAVIENVKTIRIDIHDKISELRNGDQALEPQIIEAEENLAKFAVDAMTILLKLLDEDAAANVEISKLIIGFKGKLRKENLRILLLPRGPSPSRASNDDCPSCQIFTEIKMYLERNSNPPPVSFTDLNIVSETINARITELVDSNKKGCYRDQLETLLEIRNGKNGRDGIEEVITDMREKADDEDALKKLVDRNMKRIINDVDNDHTKCMARVRTSLPNNCIQIRVQDAIKMMTNLGKRLDGEKEDQNLVQKNVGNELLEYINKNNDISLEVLESKFNNEDFDRCEEIWSKLFQDELRVKMYDIYNTARSAKYRPCSICETALEKEIGDSIELLEKMLTRDEVKNPAISSSSPSTSSPSPSTCAAGEYEQTKQYLEKVDDIIQDILLSRQLREARLEALTGFVTIKRLLTEREEKMHEAQLVVKCPREVDNIRTEYIVVLDECMQQLFDKKEADFDKQTRKQKIACAEKLREKMENRFGELYSAVFKPSLSSS